MDLITGSNCCAATVLHFFAGTADNGFAEPVDISLTLGDFRRENGYSYPGKFEGRPHIVDWNRDGQDDLLFITYIAETAQPEGSETEPSNFRQFHLFANTGLESRNDNKVSDLAPDSREGAWIWERAGNLSWRVDPVKLSISTELLKRSLDNSLTVNGELYRATFGDYDGDGQFDMLFPRSNYDYSVDSKGKEISTLVGSGIFLMRNLTTSGEPEFSKPIQIFEAPPKTNVPGISLVDLDRDGKTDVVAELVQADSPETNPAIEVWLLTQGDEKLTDK